MYSTSTLFRSLRWWPYFIIFLTFFLFSFYQVIAQNYVNAIGIGGSSGSQEVHSMTRDAANNIYLSGNLSGTVDFDPGSGTANLFRFGPPSGFIARYDEAGNYQWAVGIVSGRAPVFGGYDMEIDGAGDLVLSGYYFDTATFDPLGVPVKVGSNGAHDVFIAKYDTTGALKWAKGFGGAAPDYAHSLAVDKFNNIYVGGYFIGSSDFDPGTGTSILTGMRGSPDAFIAKYDSKGNFLWAVNVGGNAQDEGLEIDLDTAGNVYLTGYFQNTADFDASSGTANLTSAGAQDIFIVKYSPSGNFVWAKGIGDVGKDEGKSIQVDEAGNVWLTGIFTGTVDFDPGTGASNLTSAGGSDVFLAKYDTNGDFIWAKGIGGTGTDEVMEMDLDKNGDSYLTGHFTGTSDFDPSPAIANLISIGDEDIFMARYNPSGDYEWASNIGGIANDQGVSLVVENNQNLYLTGSYIGTVDFDPSPSTANLIAGSSKDIFLAKYNFCQAFSTNVSDTICVGDTMGFHGQLLSTTGTYTANLISTQGCDSIVTLKLSVDSVEGFTIDKNFSTLSATLLMADYQWIDCNDGNSIINGETFPTFTANENGSYALIVTQNQCVDTSACITIDSIGVGISEWKNEPISSIYPNPVKDYAIVELNQSTQLTLYDLTGKVIFTRQFNAGRQVIDLSNLNAGIFYLRTGSSDVPFKLVVLD